MSVHRLSCFPKGVKWRNLVGLLSLDGQQTAASLPRQIHQQRCISSLVCPHLASVHSYTERRGCFHPVDLSTNTGLLLVVAFEPQHSLHDWNSVRSYSTFPKQSPAKEQDLDASSSSKTESKQQQTEQQHHVSEVDSDKTAVVSEENPGILSGILKRFKEAYKVYGKALVAVHAVTSSVWFGSFYYVAASGVDIARLLHKIGASDKIIEQLQSTGLGYAAVAYLMYKLATPARYTVTILGTQFSVKYLRRWGYMKAVPEGDSLKDLWQEGKSEMKDKYEEKKVEMKERYEDKKEEMKEKYEDKKEEMKEKYEEKKVEMKERYEDKKEEMKEKYEDKKEEMKDKYVETKEEMKDRVGDLQEEMRDKAKELTEDVKEKLKDKATDLNTELGEKIKKKDPKR